jgi:DNA-directed RNA polymerase subunit RPC12/RpoP
MIIQTDIISKCDKCQRRFIDIIEYKRVLCPYCDKSKIKKKMEKGEDYF